MNAALKTLFIALILALFATPAFAVGSGSTNVPGFGNASTSGTRQGDSSSRLGIDRGDSSSRLGVDPGDTSSRLGSDRGDSSTRLGTDPADSSAYIFTRPGDSSTRIGGPNGVDTPSGSLANGHATPDLIPYGGGNAYTIPYGGNAGQQPALSPIPTNRQPKLLTSSPDLLSNSPVDDGE